jgi:hypothetical protein
VTEKHYKPWVKTLQDKLETDAMKGWPQPRRSRKARSPKREITSKRILLHRLERREQALLILRGRSFKRLTCGVGEDEIPGHSSGR